MISRLLRRVGLSRRRSAFDYDDDAIWSPSLKRVVAMGRATVGVSTYGYPTVSLFDDETNLVIGSFSSIGAEVAILLGGEHRMDWVTTSPLRMLHRLPNAGHDGHPKRVGDVVIGSDVWIAQRATILAGTVIGHGAVIGAGAVVSGEIPPYAIVAGNRGEIVRYRFDEKQRAALLAIAWWEWPVDDVIARVGDLCADNVDAFIAKFS